MRMKRIGYTLMLIGILLPLYFLGQFMVQEVTITRTMRQTIEKNTVLSTELQQQVEAYTVQNSEQMAQDPFTTANKRKATEVVGYLIIPKIASVQELRLGATEANLELGVAHMAGTVMPGMPKGRTMIAGHRSRVNNLMFFRINELEEGDLLYLLVDNRVLEYRVTDSKVIPATNAKEILQPYPDKTMLSLLTCDPIYPPFKDRLIVDSEFVADRTTERESIEQQFQETQVRWNLPMATATVGLSMLVGIVGFFWGKMEWNNYKTNKKQ